MVQPPTQPPVLEVLIPTREIATHQEKAADTERTNASLRKNGRADPEVDIPGRIAECVSPTSQMVGPVRPEQEYFQVSLADGQARPRAAQGLEPISAAPASRLSPSVHVDETTLVDAHRGPVVGAGPISALLGATGGDLVNPVDPELGRELTPHSGMSPQEEIAFAKLKRFCSGVLKILAPPAPS